MEAKKKIKPYRKVRFGRFSLTFWKYNVLLNNGKDKDDISYLERWVPVRKACLQYSKKDKCTKEWINQCIWMDDVEIRDLGKLLDESNQQICEEISRSLDKENNDEEGDDSSPSFENNGGDE